MRSAWCASDRIEADRSRLLFMKILSATPTLLEIELHRVLGDQTNELPEWQRPGAKLASRSSVKDEVIGDALPPRGQAATLTT